MTMSRFLLERVWLLLIVLIAVQCILIRIWFAQRTPRSARMVCVGFVLLVLLPLISVLAITPREQIIHACRRLARCVDDGDVAAVGAALASDFTASDLDRDAFLFRVEQSLTRHHLDAVDLSAFAVSVERAQAVAEFHASCSVRTTDAYRDRLVSRWRLTFRQRDRDWLVTRIEALPTPFSPVSTLGDAFR